MSAAAVATLHAAPVLREVRLYGRLGKQFGRVFRLAVHTPGEAARALCAVLPGFRQLFIGKDGRAAYHVYVGRGERRRDIGEHEAQAPVGAGEVIRFVPLVEGAKRQGVVQTILGIVLIAAGVIFENPGLVQLGLTMLAGGVVQLLSPQRGKDERKEGTPSYAFDGPINNTEQGGPVPVVLGRAICGSTVVSQGLSTVEIVIPPPAPPVEVPQPPYDAGGGGDVGFAPGENDNAPADDGEGANVEGGGEA